MRRRGAENGSKTKGDVRRGGLGLSELPCRQDQTKITHCKQAYTKQERKAGTI